MLRKSGKCLFQKYFGVLTKPNFVKDFCLNIDEFVGGEYFTDVLLMTPGPTFVPEEIRQSMTKKMINPDLDLNFYEYYKNLCEKIQKLLKTKNETFILNGEGILGLEVSIASLVEKGDKVLCIDNGVFGQGFGEFVDIYQGNTIYFKNDYRKEIDLEELTEYLEKEKNIKIATLVHCETPSGITNNIKEICSLLKKHGIITVVDAVSSIGGEEVEVDEWGIDIMLGGSQKVLSSPPGLTFLSVSEDAWNKIENRKTKIASFYCSLLPWKNWYKEKWFPYSQPVSNIFALETAIDRVLNDKNIINRHSTIAKACREAISESGLELYPKNGWSNTVTCVNIPEGISWNEIFVGMLEKNVMIGGSLGHLTGKAFRIGHMGENCYEEKVYITLKHLNEVLRNKGIELKNDLHKLFVDKMDIK